MPNVGWGKFPGHDLFSEDANFALELLLLMLLVLGTAHIVVVKAKFEYSEILWTLRRRFQNHPPIHTHIAQTHTHLRYCVAVLHLKNHDWQLFVSEKETHRKRGRAREKEGRVCVCEKEDWKVCVWERERREEKWDRRRVTERERERQWQRFITAFLQNLSLKGIKVFIFYDTPVEVLEINFKEISF